MTDFLPCEARTGPLEAAGCELALLAREMGPDDLQRLREHRLLPELGRSAARLIQMHAVAGPSSIEHHCMLLKGGHGGPAHMCGCGATWNDGAAGVDTPLSFSLDRRL